MPEPIKIYYIYALINPIDGEPYYVGCSTNPKKRAYNHRNGDQSQHCQEKHAIEDAIFAAGKKPELEILDQVGVADREHRVYAFSVEKFWTLKLLRQGKNIVGLNVKTYYTQLVKEDTNIDRAIDRYKRYALDTSGRSSW